MCPAQTGGALVAAAGQMPMASQFGKAQATCRAICLGTWSQNEGLYLRRPYGSARYVWPASGPPPRARELAQGLIRRNGAPGQLTFDWCWPQPESANRPTTNHTRATAVQLQPLRVERRLPWFRMAAFRKVEGPLGVDSRSLAEARQLALTASCSRSVPLSKSLQSRHSLPRIVEKAHRSQQHRKSVNLSRTLLSAPGTAG